MALKEYQSLCKIKQQTIVSKDQGNSQKHIAHNVDKDEVYQYKVDGYLICEGIRCDFLVWNEKKKHIYFIELKGSDLLHALDQIDATEKDLKKRFPVEMKSCEKVSYRVVLNRYSAPKVYGNKEKIFRKNHLGDLALSTKVFEEAI